MQSIWQWLDRASRRLIPARAASVARRARALLPHSLVPRDRGERAAARYCTSLGWELIDVNLRIGHDEGDLLCLDESNRPILVEVKSSAGGPLHPVFHVDPAKAACLRRLSLALSHDRRWRGLVPRIDVITVDLSPAGESHDRVTLHLRQAVEDGRPPRRRGVLRP